VYQNFAFSVRRLFVAFSGSFLLFSPVLHAQAAGKQVVHGSIPAVLGKLHLQPLQDLPETNRLNLAIGLPLRNQAALDHFLQQLQDPASTNYHRYLTPQEFTKQFGPTRQDYDAVINFAKTNGLSVRGTYSNRTLVDVSAEVGTIEKALHVRMHTYRHPTEKRNFFAPDAEPSVDLDVPILHISGLNNFFIPHPALVKKDSLSGVRPASGSGLYGWLMGADFRNAYVPGVTLDGSGQSVALFELEGYYTNDITGYENQAGLPKVTIDQIPVDDFPGVNLYDPNGITEVSLDIEMVISMATNLTRVIVYEAPNDLGDLPDILNRIATDNLARQISSSWLIGDNPSFDTAYQQMAAQGQSFFQASGDNGAFYTGDINQEQWADDTNITTVGGTTLTMNGSGSSYASEAVWNWFSSGLGLAASGGGTNYNSIPIPAWQVGIDMSTNGGSTSLRNVPDVSMAADGIYVLENDGEQGMVGGTSAAAPLWAAFTALVNERAAIFGNQPMGFLNPVIYAIGTGPGYVTNFNDITEGNNTNYVVGDDYFATPGYDLCTGWGSPVGGNLLGTLVPSDTLTVAPLTYFYASGPWSGPFNPSAKTYSLTNTTGTALCWSLINTSSWLSASSMGGTFDPEATTNEVITINAAADTLAPGTYSASIQFSNWTTGVAQTFPFSLQVIQPLVITPPVLTFVSGWPNGPFSRTSLCFTLTNLGAAPLNWQAGSTTNWLSVSATGGTLAGGAQTNVIFSLNSTASNLVEGAYSTVISITNQTLGTMQSWPFLLSIGQSLVLNGGFETGDFTGWTLNGQSENYDLVDDGFDIPAISPHSGNYFAALGEVSYQAYLTQTLPTIPGQLYLLSLWMNSPDVEPYAPNEFSVAWNGKTLYDQVNIPPTTDSVADWTNLQFIVTATNNASVLLIGGRDDNYYLGLDDVSVVAIPSTTLQTPLSATGNGVMLFWNALVGLAYQVQGTTNLFQPNWVVLQTLTTTNATITFTDTNSMGDSPQMFYRLLLLP
jgi:hypothetical protein